MTTWSKVLEIIFRVIGFLLCGAFALGSLWAARDGTYPNLSGLSQALLMLLCVLSPTRPSRAMLVALLIALILAGMDFAIRALPELKYEQFPADIVALYFVEVIIAIWFIGKHSFRPSGLNNPTRDT